MTAGDSRNEELRRAFEDAPGALPPEGGCPATEEIWLGARGELVGERRRAFLDHLVECAACARSCNIAAELIAQEAAEVSAEARGSGFGWVRVLVPAAAVLVAALLWIAPFDRTGRDAPEEFREPETLAIDSGLDEATPLPRERCVLRWSPGPEGTLYSVRVSSEELRVLARADELSEPRYEVPAEALDALADGDTFLWRVEALLPDATRVSSPVFRASVE